MNNIFVRTEGRYKGLIPLLLILVAIRFVFVPIFEWQAEKIDNISNLEEKISKTKNVIARKNTIDRHLNSLSVDNQNMLSRYYNNASNNNFKLRQQQQLEKLFHKHNVKIRNFNWIASIPGYVTQERTNIVFEGRLKDIALLQMSLARLPKLISIKQWAFSIRNMSQTSLGHVSGNFLLVSHTVTQEMIDEMPGSEID